MLSFEPRIAVVDDKINEVDGILEKYRDDGIGIKYFNAHLTNGDEKPTLHFSDLNLIYLDVHFTDTTSDYDPTHCAAWIDSLIPEYSFYVLVLWSKETEKKDEILEELKNIKKSPFLCFAEQKTDYQTESGWDFEKLDQSIISKLADYPELEELAIWKKSILYSSNTIIGHLVKDISTDPNALKKKLQKIIIGHGGKYLLRPNNEKEKRKVLFDAMDNVLCSNAKSTRPSDIIGENNINSLYNIIELPESDIDSKLNSWFHFNLHKEPLDQSTIISGLICEYKESSLKESYGLLADDNIEEYLKHQITRSKAENSNTKLIDIVCLISRPCDLAQKKYGRNLKLISGMCVVNPARKNNPKKEFQTGNKFDSIKLFDHLAYSSEETDIALVFDYRYIFSVPENIFIEKFENKKIFNKELLSEIQVEYSSYSSRLGITQII